MSPELEKKLADDFPVLFRGRSKPLTESLMRFGCEHDDGWFNIIYCLCEAINYHLKNSELDFEFTQIKEKFGTLRVYCSATDDYIEGVIRMAENISSYTCEVTGRPAKMCRRGHWYRTLCSEEAEKEGYAPVKGEAG